VQRQTTFVAPIVMAQCASINNRSNTVLGTTLSTVYGPILNIAEVGPISWASTECHFSPSYSANSFLNPDAE